MIDIVVMKLNEIQPSQLFISSDKLSHVMIDLDPLKPESLHPIPVKRLGNQVIFTDGHTRAFAAFLSGFSEVRVFWDEDELDWEAYEICVKWCKEEGICTVADLKDRVVASAEYEVLWLKRCEEMQKDLEARRRLKWLGPLHMIAYSRFTSLNRQLSELLPLTQTEGGLFALVQQESRLYVDFHKPLTQTTLRVKVPCELSTVAVLATDGRN